MSNKLIISKHILSLIKNCFKRDIEEEGKQIRQEILDEIDKDVVELDYMHLPLLMPSTMPSTITYSLGYMYAGVNAGKHTLH